MHRFIFNIFLVYFTSLIAVGNAAPTPEARSNTTISFSQEIEKFSKVDNSLYNVPLIDFYNDKEEKVRFDLWDGQLLLVYMWASWCNACIPDLVTLNSLAKKIQKAEIQLIPISVDYKGLEAVQHFYAQHDLQHLDRYIDKKNQLYQALSVQALPTTFIINEKGEVVRKMAGPLQWHDAHLMEWLEQFKQKPQFATPQPRPAS